MCIYQTETLPNVTSWWMGSNERSDYKNDWLVSLATLMSFWQMMTIIAHCPQQQTAKMLKLKIVYT